MKKIIPFIFILVTVTIFFWQFFLKGYLPIPSDTLVGLYNPFRDFYSQDYPRGIPFKNFLITDPIRQQYVWRFVSTNILKSGNFPIWNPYSGLGMPLFANIQSAVLSPLNILSLILPFSISWTFQVFFTLLLGSCFVYLYLRQLKISKISSTFSAVSFIFCGFSTSWLEWNTLLPTLIWLPIILYLIEKFFMTATFRKKILYSFLISLSLSFSIFSGHLQTFFYVGVFIFFYFLLKAYSIGKLKKTLWFLFLIFVLFFVISSVQIIPTLQLISLSGRAIDINWKNPGWFVPFSQLIQFLIPDFFGNPSTLNYWGVWNYGEIIGYIGIIPIVFTFLGGVFVRRKLIYFYIGVIILSFIFMTENPISKLPFILNVPFLSSAQPTRMTGIIDFALIVLCAFGIDHLRKITMRQIIVTISIFSLIFASIWAFILMGKHEVTLDQLIIAKRNSILPTFLLILTFIGLVLSITKKNKYLPFILMLLLIFSAYDLIRFDMKYNPFVNKKYLYPTTKSIMFLKQNLGNYRYMTTDDRIMPPNVGAYYGLYSLDVYDPLYLMRYGEFIAAMQRGRPDINPPFGFNRILTPHNYESPFIDLLGVKYVVSLSEIKDIKFKEVFDEGETKIYENKKVLNRAFFVENVTKSTSKEESIQKMFEYRDNLSGNAIVEDLESSKFNVGEVKYILNSPNKIVLSIQNKGNGFLVLTNSYYPSWHAYIDGHETRIYTTDYMMQGIIVPKGNHTIAFQVSLF
ncbi:MAG TPA: YfhO family protein [Patescibacteria group bacterium]